MNEITVAPLDLSKVDGIRASTELLCTRARNAVVTNQYEYESAAEILAKLKGRAKEVEALRKSITKPLDDSKKAVMDLFRKPMEWLEQSEAQLKGVMTGYVEEQEEKRAYEQEQLRLKAEKERLALEKKAEEARAKGKNDRAAELEMRAATVVAPTVEETVVAVQGVSYRDQWTPEIVDVKQIPIEFLLPNMDALRKVGQATKGSINIPGVRFIHSKVLASRSE